MIATATVKPLLMDAPSEPGRPAHVAAASGVVRLGRFLYVVADDEVALAVFEENAPRGRWVELLPAELPLDPEARKAVKPDLEVLTRLPPRPAWPDGALLALPSGSGGRRRTGALASLDPVGALAGPTFTFDLQPLFDALRPGVEAVNVEGAALLKDALLLLQRGQRGRPSALAEVDLEALAAAVAARAPVPASALRRVTPVSLPEADGWPLAFTDGLALADGTIAFTAVAEASEDPYVDAPCAGSAVGRMTRQGKVLALEWLKGAPKVEGIALHGHEAWLVTDDDAPDRPARLLSCKLP